jgi:hypothetical protein
VKTQHFTYLDVVDFTEGRSAQASCCSYRLINIIQIGAGQVTINAVTSGTTTVLSNGGTAAAPKLRAQYSAATLVKVATDTWYVIGDIS